jgi:hypothetical protein
MHLCKLLYVCVCVCVCVCVYIYVAAWNLPDVFLKNPKLFEGNLGKICVCFYFLHISEVKFGVKTLMS